MGATTIPFKCWDSLTQGVKPIGNYRSVPTQVLNMQLPLPLLLCPVLSGVSCWSSGARCVSPHTHSGRPSTTLFREVSTPITPITGINSAAPCHGRCLTTTLPFSCAPWTCQAMADLPQVFLSLNFLFLPTHCGSQGMYLCC